jgi:hypothetical protein
MVPRLMRARPTWIRWLAVVLVSLIGIMGSYASATCHCGHEDAAAHGADACADCDTCDGVCLCHLTIMPWHEADTLLATMRLHDASDTGFAHEGDLHGRLIYSPPRG